MSLISDALKKARQEAARQDSLPPGSALRRSGVADAPAGARSLDLAAGGAGRRLHPRGGVVRPRLLRRLGSVPQARGGDPGRRRLPRGSRRRSGRARSGGSGSAGHDRRGPGGSRSLPPAPRQAPPGRRVPRRPRQPRQDAAPPAPASPPVAGGSRSHPQHGGPGFSRRAGRPRLPRPARSLRSRAPAGGLAEGKVYTGEVPVPGGGQRQAERHRLLPGPPDRGARRPGDGPGRERAGLHGRGDRIRPREAPGARHDGVPLAEIAASRLFEAGKRRGNPEKPGREA